MEDITFTATETAKIAALNTAIVTKGQALVTSQWKAVEHIVGLMVKYNLTEAQAVLPILNRAYIAKGILVLDDGGEIVADARWIANKSKLSKALAVFKHFDSAEAVFAAAPTWNAAYESITTKTATASVPVKLATKVAAEIAKGNVGARDAAAIVRAAWDGMSTTAQAAFIAEMSA